ncbi:hypothetical protein DXG03_002870 [Asterophora parasitica]|uniref:Uncharacterized protein n=1 Tax=Asterophora parasitica TaxID=117018 RepID=A0A9P7GG86_9AGAR|nr:hypothetical protein DXG03_002870 [Asterophora parasitica]
MARKFFSVLRLTAWTLLWTLSAHGQAISTDTAVPPLQWINLSALLQGSSRPPPLKNAAIGYDETSRSVIIFGGESASGLAQSQTFLLNLETLTWSVPTPPDNLQRTPAARSAVVSGVDSAASNRQGFVVIGGKGSDGQGLSDVWVRILRTNWSAEIERLLFQEYDFNNQFWSEVNMSPGGPLPRWGASGGIDISTQPIQDPILPGPNNTFYLAGGFNGSRPSSLSDVWRLNLSGTLSSNLPDNVQGSWSHLNIGQLPSKSNESGTVVNHQLVLTGGCTSSTEDGTCAEQDTYVIDTQRRSENSPNVCPAPRRTPVLVRNANSFTSTFSTQVYLLLGIIDKTRWKDDDGLDNGEVAVLDIQAGTWSRILPSGDPGSSGTPTFPTPREGSAAFSYPRSLVGQSRGASSDTLIFGGQDSFGNVLSDVWLLRSYTGLVTPSAPQWSGFGDGQLRTGINANGTGVRVKYMTQCAVAVTPSPTGTTPPPSNSSSPTKSSVHIFNTSVVHKILAPISLVVLQISFLVFRLASPLYQKNSPWIHASYGAAVLAFVAYGLGLAGLATSFTAISAAASSKGSGLHLRTGHGIAGIVFFAVLYVILPGLLALNFWQTRTRTLAQGSESESEKVDPARVASPRASGIVEWPSSRSAVHSMHSVSSPSSRRHRTNSWGPSTAIHNQVPAEGRLSSDSESVPSSPVPKRKFEVVNRPSTQKISNWRSAADGSSDRLRDIDWLQRRRSLNAVVIVHSNLFESNDGTDCFMKGELDYALSQVRREQLLSTPGTTDGLMPTTTPHLSRPLDFPNVPEISLHILIQFAFLGLSIITLIALWSRAPKAAFGGFLAWTIIFYIIIFSFAWNLLPQRSILSAILSRQRPQPQSNVPASPASVAEESPSPYTHHQPPHRVASGTDEMSLSHAGPRSTTEPDDDDDDLDDDTRQRMIEDEIGRRDVSIVTVPKRKLWVANP